MALVALLGLTDYSANHVKDNRSFIGGILIEIRNCTPLDLGNDCGHCRHAKTNGFYAPSIWCDLLKKNEQTDTYMKIDNKYPGTTCDLFEKKER